MDINTIVQFTILPAPVSPCLKFTTPNIEVPLRLWSKFTSCTLFPHILTLNSPGKENDPYYRSESELLGKSFDGPFYYPYQRKIKSKGRIEKSKKIFDKEKDHERKRRKRRRLVVKKRV